MPLCDQSLLYPCRNGVYYLDPPLIVEVVPVDSNPPVITASNVQLNYTETTVLNVLEGVALSDLDQNCQSSIIIGAQVEITTEASDNAWEMLEVRSMSVYWYRGIRDFLCRWVMLTSVEGCLGTAELQMLRLIWSGSLAHPLEANLF